MPFLPDLRLEVAFNSGVHTAPPSRVWTDVSAYVELDQGITISGGRADEHSLADPNRLTLTLDNKDGRFTPEKTGSPYYPNVKLGRPIRLRANVLTNGNRGTFDSDITGWSGTSCTLARVTTPVQAGAGAMSMTATSAATISAAASTTGALVDDVAPGEYYVAEAWIRRNGGTARDARVDIEWYTSGGALISTTAGATIALTTSYQLATVSGALSPATAAFARVVVVVISAANGEAFHVDEAALLSERFLGFVDEWPVEWPDGSDVSTLSTVSASSRLAQLGEDSDALLSIIQAELAIDGPVAHYTLGEPAKSTQAADTSGAGQNPLKQNANGVAVDFGTATGPGTDDLTAAKFTQGEKYLKAQLTPPTGDWTAECFFSCTSSGVFQVILGFGEFSVSIASGTDNIELRSRFSVGSGTGLAVTDGATRHIAVTYTAATNTAKLYVDAVLKSTLVDATSNGLTGKLYVGNGIANADGEISRAFTLGGVVAHAVVFPQVISTVRINQHQHSGNDGFDGEVPFIRLPRYASYAGCLTDDVLFDVGLVSMGTKNTTGHSPLEMLRLVEATDGGVLFDRRDGRLGYRDQQSRYQQTTPAFTLSAATQQLDARLRPILDKSQLLNDVTTKNPSGTVSARYVNQSSINENGRRAVEIEMLTDDADQLYVAAGGLVNKYAVPRVRVPQLAAVDILTLDDALQAQLMAADVSTMFTVTGLPSQAPASSAAYFIEGYTDTIGPESWVRTFNVSAAALSLAWLLDSATRSQLDSTTVLG